MSYFMIISWLAIVPLQFSFDRIGTPWHSQWWYPESTDLRYFPEGLYQAQLASSLQKPRLWRVGMRHTESRHRFILGTRQAEFACAFPVAGCWSCFNSVEVRTCLLRFVPDSQRRTKPETFRYIQIHSDTFRYIQIHSDTFRYIQIHSDDIFDAFCTCDTSTLRLPWPSDPTSPGLGCRWLAPIGVRQGIYPLVNIQKAMENHHF